MSHHTNMHTITISLELPHDKPVDDVFDVDGTLTRPDIATFFCQLRTDQIGCSSRFCCQYTPGKCFAVSNNELHSADLL